MSFDVAGITAWLVILSSAATAAMILAILGVRWFTTTRRHRQARERDAVGPLLLRVADGEAVAVPDDRRLAAALGRAAAEMVHKVRGADRKALADWLNAAGYREQALGMMSSRLASRRAQAVELYLATTSGTEPEPVIAMLRDPHPRVRATAVRALGSSGAAEAVPALITAVGGRRRSISASAAAMAIVHAAPSSAADLGGAWESGDYRVRQVAVDIAGHLGLADARTELERALTSNDARLRLHAALALVRIGAPLSVGVRQLAMGRTTPGSPEEAALRDALAELGDAPDGGASR